MKLFLVILSIILLTSCKSYKNVIYFQTEKSSQNDTIRYSNELKYQTGDILQIIVSSSDPDAVKPFNIYQTMSESSVSNEFQGYMIDKSGFIDFPVIGKIETKGLTRNQLVDTLKLKLKDYVKQPSFQIQLKNFRITVLGDVKRPGTFTMNSENISILEALGYAEDLTISAKRSDVSIIREENGKRIQYKIDLRDPNLINSSFYYLKQNDVVYVQPGKIKILNENFGSSFSALISLVSLSISTLIFITLVN